MSFSFSNGINPYFLRLDFNSILMLLLRREIGVWSFDSSMLFSDPEPQQIRKPANSHQPSSFSPE
jgi:hypothetical protein